jgi:hypothetical protein
MAGELLSTVSRQPFLDYEYITFVKYCNIYFSLV